MAVSIAVANTATASTTKTTSNQTAIIDLMCAHSGKRSIDLASRENFAQIDEAPKAKGFIYFFSDGSRFIVDQLVDPYVYAYADSKGNAEPCYIYQREWK